MVDPSEEIRGIIRAARLEALRVGSASIGCEHLLAGCVQDGSDHRAAHILRDELGVSLERIRAALPRGEEEPAAPILSIRPEVRYCIHRMFDIARAHQQISPNGVHLLAALVRDSTNSAIELLQTLDVNLEALARLVAQALPLDDAVLEASPFKVGEPGGRDKFTSRARQVLYRAQEEAWLFEQGIDREHLLLALLYEREGAAFRVMQSLSIDITACELALTRTLMQRDQGASVLMPRSKRAIELAVNEAVRLRHHYLGTEHLLLGILSSCEEKSNSPNLLTRLGLRTRNEEGDPLGRLLIRFDLTLNRTRQQALLVLASGEPE